MAKTKKAPGLWAKYKAMSKENKLIFWLWVLFAIPTLSVGLIILLVWMFADIPSFEELERPDNKLATQVLAIDGELLTTFHVENRSYAVYEDLSPNLVNAAVSTEDERFYSHSGIDFRSLGRVAVKTILGGDSSQGGGSTITQQLAKTLYPREDLSSSPAGIRHAKMVVIKLKEWVTAVKLERSYTKNEILCMYLNSVFFGSNAYGIKAASKTFFAKEPAYLTVEEAATLVGMVNKPTRYNPVLNPEKSKTRRDLVIRKMARYGYLTQHEADSIQQLPIKLAYQVQDHNAGLAPYFRDMLKRTMSAKKPKRSNYTYVEDYKADSLLWENDPLYGWLNKNTKADGTPYNLERDGLRIYTTINYKMQKYAEEAVAEHLGKDLQNSFWKDLKWKRNKPFSNDVSDNVRELVMRQGRKNSDRYRHMKKAGYNEDKILESFSQPIKMRVFAWNSKGYVDTLMTPDDSIKYYLSHLRCGFMAMEPHTGHVKAYVGGPNYRYFKWDNVRQSARQVGSTIKPFLYCLAMQEGKTPCDQVINIPTTFKVGNGTWTPRTTDRADWIGKTVTLKWGLTHSSNNISAHLMKEYGPAAMIRQMRKLGISTYLPDAPSLCVGTPEIKVFDMVAAYNTFPSRGVYIAPYFVTRIEDDLGNVIGEFYPQKREAIGEDTAYLMANLMQGVVTGGTGVRLRYKYKLHGEIAGKTGTTNKNADGWFIGYTPTLTAGIWAGAENQNIHFQSTSLGGGANMALPIWGLFMQKVLADGTLGISASDKFTPSGKRVDLSCTGSETYAGGGPSDEESLFFD